MSTETLKDKVIFGRSVTKETMVVSFVTLLVKLWNRVQSK